MKGFVEHRQPLSDAAMEVLDQAQALDDGSGLIFPSPIRPGHPLSDMTLTKVLRDNGLASGRRSTDFAPPSGIGPPRAQMLTTL